MSDPGTTPSSMWADDEFDSDFAEYLDALEFDPRRAPSLWPSDVERAADFERRIAALRRAGLLASATSGSTPPARGPRVPGFELVRRIGAGSMGVVYEARQVELDRRVALKIVRAELTSSWTARLRFRREARAVARLTHPSIVTVHTCGEADGICYLAMELVEGAGMEERIASTGGLPWRDVARWGARLADGLAAAHAAGVVHRDVKPHNVRFAGRGSPKLLDFGLARLLDERAMTRTGSFQGTPFYCAPELITGDGDPSDPRGDVYSLGATLYEALAGSVPFGGRTAEQVIHRVLTAEPRRLGRTVPGLPRELETVVNKALEKRPDDRYQRASDLAEDLRAVVDGRAVRAAPPSIGRRASRWVGRHPRSATLLALLIALLASIPVLLVARQRAAEAEAARDALHRAEAGVDWLRDANAAVLDRMVRLRQLRNERVTSYIDRHEEQALIETERDLARAAREIEARTIMALTDLQRAAVDPDLSELERAARVELHVMAYRAREAVTRGGVQTYEEWSNTSREQDAIAAELRELGAADRIDRMVPLVVRTNPPGAEVFAFQYGGVDGARAPPADRLVAKPWPAGDPSDPPPGTWAVCPLVPVAGCGPGDLIVEIEGRPLGECVVVRDDVGVLRRWDRLLAVGQTAITDPMQADAARVRSEAFRIERLGASGRTRFSVDRNALPGVEFAWPSELARQVSATCRVRRADGDVEDVVLPPLGEVRLTGTPLFASRECRLGVTPLQASVPERRTLLLIRADGYVDQRQWVESLEDRDWTVHVRLVPAGVVPPEFVPIRDDQWLCDREVTCVEYLEFLADPGVQARIDASSVPVLVPRRTAEDRVEALWPRGADGRFRLPDDLPPDLPVLSISWHDAKDYAAWRTRRDEVRYPGIRFDLATAELWMTGRATAGFFPYGDYFRPKWVSSCFSRQVPDPAPAPVLSYPLDENVFGIFDLGGSAAEYLDAQFASRADERLFLRASWAQTEGDVLTARSAAGVRHDVVDIAIGFRLAAYRR